MLDGMTALGKRSHDRFGLPGIVLIGLVLTTVVGMAIHLVDSPTLAETGILEKLEAEERLSIGERIYYGTRLAGFGIVALGLVLLGTSFFWARRLPSESKSSRNFRPSPIPGWTWALLLVAVLVAGFSRAPRLDHSLWNDEEVAVRKFIVGGHGFHPQTGELEFRPVGWDRTLFYSLSGNNHIAQSVASRIGHELWKKSTGAVPGDFSETALRLGSFLAGLGTIALLGLWLARHGHPVAGVTAAFLLALHPWHGRYAVEARGYSLLLFFVVLMFFFLAPAIQSGRWRYWLGFGFAQAMALLSFAASAFLLLPVNLIILAVLLYRRDGYYSLGRWLFVSACGAGAVAYFLLPTVVGSMGWLASLEEKAHPNDWSQLREFLSHLLLGIHWQPGNPDLDFGVGIRDLTRGRPVASFLLLFALPIAFLFGSLIAWSRSRASRFLILGVFLSLVLITLFREFSTTPFHVWYAVYAMLWFVVAMGFFAEAFVSPSPDSGLPEAKPRRFPSWKSWVPATVIILVYASLSSLPNQRMRTHPRHPMREAVQVIYREIPAFQSSETWSTIAIGAGARQFQSYDPHIALPESPEEFQELLAEAEKEGRRISVFVTGPLEARASYPEIFRELDDRSRFDEVALVKGIEAFWSIQIFQQRPAS